MKRIIVLALLLGVMNVFSQKIKFGKVSKEELEEKVHPLDSAANATYLYKHRRTYVEYNQSIGFQIVSDYHFRIKIYNKEGFDYANFNLGYYKPESGEAEKISNLKAYTFNLNEAGEIEKTKLTKDGIFKEKVNRFRGAKKVSMPNVKEGAVIDLQYKLVSPYYMHVDDLSYQADIPIKKFYAKVEIPEWFMYNKRSKGFYFITPKSYKKAGRIPFIQVSFINNVDEYNATNVPALSDREPYIASVKTYQGGVQYELSYTNFPNEVIKTYTTTWEKVSKQIYDRSFGKEIGKRGYYKDDLAAVLEGATSDFDKLIQIFQLVKQKVKWNGVKGLYVDQGVKTAYKTGVGNVADINLMLTSMLKTAGLTANPVMVSTRGNGKPMFPTIKGFDYVVSMVEFSDNSYALLDATEPYSIPNLLPLRALNFQGRKVTESGYSSWVNLISSEHASETNTVKIAIDEEGEVEGFLRQKVDNLNAMLTRKRYNPLKEEDAISKIEENYDIEIEDFRVGNEKDLGKPYTRMLKFTSEDLVEEINGKLYINPLLFFSQLQNPFKANERKYPIDFASPWKEANKISIQIPEGYQVESIPEQLAIGVSDELGFFKFIAVNKGNAIQVSSALQFNSAIIGPNYYQEVKDFYAQLVAKQKEKIVLSKKQI